MSTIPVSASPSQAVNTAPVRPIDPAWQVKPEAQAPAAPSAPETYGPTLESENRVGQYARDDFQQLSFPDSSRFEKGPSIKERVKEFAHDHPGLAAAVGAGVVVAAGEFEAKKNVSILGVEGKIEVKAEYDGNAHRIDPASGNRYSVGSESSVSVGLRIPLGGNR